MLNYLLQLPRVAKRIISICIDVFIIALAFFGSFGIRYDNSSAFYSITHWYIYCALLIITL
ncbi:hypothetical protein, partial [Rodentibacter pneumotropicus]|uniref:hypothetical protein n=1 Tax=Rodentibacter pneumotropicus TaxID=758 RepID=UPI001EE20293